MEEKKKKRQEEKKKKEAAQKKAAELKTKVPESAKPGPSPPHPASPSVISSSSSGGGGGNGKRTPSGVQQQAPPAAATATATAPAPRYPPREVPPRFRQHEHKQLLKRGQPPPGAHSHAEAPHQSGPGAQYESPHWGLRSTASHGWDQVIIDESDTEAWPSISRGDRQTPSGCAAEPDCPTETSSSSMSTALSPGQPGHFSAHHPGSQGVASRGWASGPAHCPPSIGEGRTDSLPVGGRGHPCWSAPGFTVNLNPSANPAAWPVLGQDEAGSGSDSPPCPDLCSPAEAPPAQCIANGNLAGGRSTWGSVMASHKASESRSGQTSNVSFSVEPQNLNTDGPIGTKREHLSPMAGWGGAGHLIQQTPQAPPQVNGEDGSAWGNGDSKPPAPPGLLAAWGQGGNGGGSTGTWEATPGGDWGKRSSEPKGWDPASASIPQEHLGSWPRAADDPASEGSGDGSFGAEAPPLRRQDLDPRVLCNTGWGQTPVRQHTAWQMEEASRSDHKSDAGTEAWSSSSSSGSGSASSSGSSPHPEGTAASRPDSGGKGEGSSTAAAPGWGGSAPPPSQPGSRWREPPVNGKKATNGFRDWGDAPAGSPNGGNLKNGPSWGSEEKSPSWEEPPPKSKPQSWGECPKSAHSWGNGTGGVSGPASDWGEPGDDKKNSTSNAPWEPEGTGWKESPRGWGKPAPSSGGAWEDTQRPSGPGQGWGQKPQEDSQRSSGPGQGWGQKPQEDSQRSSGPGQGWGQKPQEDSQRPSGPGQGWGQKPQEDSQRPSGPGQGWGQKPQEDTQRPSGPGQGWGQKPQEDTQRPSGPGQGWGQKPQEDSQRPSGPGQGWGQKPQEDSQRPSGPGQGWGQKPLEDTQRPSGPGQGWGQKPQEDSQRPSGPGQGWGPKPQEDTGGNGGGGGDSMGSWGGPNSVTQSNSSWGGGRGAGKQEPVEEPTGWEEPSPPSVRRKIEIDDGTSSWGDPGAYNKAVNMWDKNNPVNQSNPTPDSSSGSNASACPTAPSNTHPHHNHNHHHHHPPTHHNQPPVQSHGHNHPSNGRSSHNNDSPNPGPHQPAASQGRPPGWGELPSVQSKAETPSSWGEPALPATSVDNGTSAWGKPSSGPGGWADGGHEPAGPYGRGNGPPGSAPCKSAPKSMQDSWGGGGDEPGRPAGQWDLDEGDAWNSAASPESNSSGNSWGNPPVKGLPKGKVLGKQDDAWIMSHLVKQLTDMGFPRDPAEEALKTNHMNLDQAMSALFEKKTELDRRGTGISEYSKRPSAVSKESSSDRTPYLQKDGGLAEDTPTSPFMPSPSLKLPLSASGALPGQSSSGLAMQNLNNRQMQSGTFGGSGTAQARAVQQQQQQQQQQQAPPPQPSVPPFNSSQPNLRAQVPQFLSPQVQAQLLQFAAKNIGLNPALLTSPINPQQMTLLYQLQQLQMAYQRLQIQQQMMQGQRNVSGPLRQQEQQVARTISNMQQQIQQHQRQLSQALLMKQQQQQQQPAPAHSGLHPGASKSALDHFPGLSDLQTKEPQSSPNAYAPYHQLSGLNANISVNCMDLGGLSMKESPQPQSRLSQWTHPNCADNRQGGSPQGEPILDKHGAIPAGPGLGHQGKAPMEDSYSPYGLIPGSESPASPPERWGQGKTVNDKITNGTNVNWPPEFCPGVPWKGLQNIDPETDPNMTPGSVLSGPTINTNIQDVNRFLLRDRSGGKLSDRKSTWSPGPNSHAQASLSHDLWKVPQGPRNAAAAPSRPPPGLTHAKPSSTWGGGSLGLAPSWTSSYSSGTAWSTDSSNRTSSWLVLRNLTPQIDGSTLRTLCMQHGPLITFHLSLTQGNAVVRYSSKEEAAKAQKSLHMCVLGNTTIMAEFAGEEEVNRFFAQGQSLPPTTSWQAHPGTNQTRLGGTAGASHSVGHWNNGGLAGGGKTGGDLLWGGVQQYSSLWGPPGGEDGRVIGSPTPIHTLLPGDLLSGESM